MKFTLHDLGTLPNGERHWRIISSWTRPCTLVAYLTCEESMAKFIVAAMNAAVGFNDNDKN